MRDFLLAELFKKERWEKAINSGVVKHIDKGELRQLCKPEVRIQLYLAMKNDQYAIAPPHAQLIPKDKPGEYREVLICENLDRIILQIINEMFFEFFSEMVHESCKSYQTGIGCGKVVQEASKKCAEVKDDIVGKKYDLTKYFDSVDIKYIDEIFDTMEKKVGESKVIKIVRDFYHSDILFNEKGELISEYKSLKQGTATSSFLADACLYKIDKELSEMKNVSYYRYSDDILIIGNNYEKADEILHERLKDKGLALNPKKVEILDKKHFFKFLGFSIRGSEISLSKNRIKSFQKEIDQRTIKQKGITFTKALNNVNRFLYVGDGTYSWATSVLPIVNVTHDVNELNKYVVDCLRAVVTEKKILGGLGYCNDGQKGVIMRGTGKNVRANRDKTTKEIKGYYSIHCMQKALLTRRAVYDTLVRQM